MKYKFVLNQIIIKPQTTTIQVTQLNSTVQTVMIGTQKLNLFN
jgi:hypothetical protein